MQLRNLQQQGEDGVGVMAATPEQQEQERRHWLSWRHGKGVKTDKVKKHKHHSYSIRKKPILVEYIRLYHYYLID
jgi:hypothetical protein